LIKEIQNILLLNIDELARRNVSRIVHLISFFYAVDSVASTNALTPTIFELLQTCLAKSELPENETSQVQLGFLLLHLSEQNAIEIDELPDLIESIDKIIQKSSDTLQPDLLGRTVFDSYLIKRNRFYQLAKVDGVQPRSFFPELSKVKYGNQLPKALDINLKDGNYDFKEIPDELVVLLARGDKSILAQLSLINNVDAMIFFYTNSFKVCSPSASLVLLLNILLLGMIKIAGSLSDYDREFMHVMIHSLIKNEFAPDHFKGEVVGG